MLPPLLIGRKIGPDLTSANSSHALSSRTGQVPGLRPFGMPTSIPLQMTDSKIKSAKKLLASGVPPRDVAGNLGVSVPTLYRWIPASTQH
ncbi:MAG: hypothetical protein QOE55_7106 [Acidobacteriaceae bacterium]|jgi:DNA invertase Pin-like site-specific DNA recombinase|nr:hypothetical protein [Acidobacteriaceae bacterium]